MVPILRRFYRKIGKDSRTVLGNFFSMSMLEVINYAMPLITFPYLVRILGPGKFGLVALAQAFAMYFVWFVDYGFCLSAPRNVSIYREDKERISEIYSSVITIKGIFMILCFAVFIGIIKIIPKFSQNSWVFIFSYGYVVGDVLFPVWFFQGVERMKFITYMYFVARLLFILSVFIFIHSAPQYYIVPLLYTSGIIIAGILSQYLIYQRFGIRLKIPPFVRILKELKDGWHFFVSSISMTLYTNSSPLILGLLAGEIYVGYFVAGEKIARFLQRIIVALSLSLYPRINKLAVENRDRAFVFLRKTLIIMASCFLCTSIIIFVVRRPLTLAILGEQYKSSISIVGILAFLPFIIAIGNIFGYQTMPAFNMKKAFSTILFIAAIWHIVVSFPMVVFFKHIGSAVTLLSTEVIVTMVSYFYLRRKGIRFL